MNNKKTISIISMILVAVALIVGSILLVLRRTDTTNESNRLDIDWYNVNETEFTISTEEELYEFAELSAYYDFKGQTIKLGADIVVNEGNASDWEKESPSKQWKPINKFGGVFDGQGHTVSGLYAKDFEAPVAMFTNSLTTCTIQNLKLLNSYFESTGFGGTASIVSCGGGTFKQLYSDAILQVKGVYSGYVGGIASKIKLQTTMEECQYDGTIYTSGRDAGGILDVVLGCRVVMKHCLFSGNIKGTWDYSASRIGGLVGRVQKTGATLIIEDSLTTGKVEVGNIYYTASIVGVSYGNTALNATNTYGSLETFDVVIGRSGASGTITGMPLALREKDLIGNRAYEWTNLDFTTYWTIVENDTPALQCFAEKIESTEGLTKAFDISWFQEDKSEYLITNKAQLYGMYYLSASQTFEGKTIKVGADIAINEGNASDWKKNEPENYWYAVTKFAGTFDGQDHTISGIYQSSSTEQTGLFKETTLMSTVKNFRLTNSYYCNTTTDNAIMGSIAGRGNGTYENIYSDAIILSHGNIVGGLIGQVNALAKNKISNCWFDGSISLKGESARYSGGIIGTVVKGNTTVEHCLNTANIVSECKGMGVFAAGIVSSTMNKDTVLTINDCFNAGYIKVGYDVCVGSVIGRIQPSAAEGTTITNTYTFSETYKHPEQGFLGVGTQSGDAYTGGVVDYKRSDLIGYGAYQRTTLDFNNYWAVDMNGTPVLKSYATNVPNLKNVKKLVDISWYSVDAKTMTIDSLEDLYGFYIVTALDQLEGKTVRLGKDIIVNEGSAADWSNTTPSMTWNPLKAFSGTFDGQGHTISGLCLKSEDAYVGLFGTIAQKGIVKNLSIKNSYFNTTKTGISAIGSIVGKMSGTLDTVYSNAIVEAPGMQIGGLAGRIDHSDLASYKITNCWFDGLVSGSSETSTGSYIGGIAGGLVRGTLEMSHCLNTGKVRYIYEKLPVNSKGEVQNNAVYVGGLLGGLMNSKKVDDKGNVTRVSEVIISDSLNSGEIIVESKEGKAHTSGIGSVFGYTSAAAVTMKNVYATSESCTRTVHYNSKKATIQGSALVLPEAFISGYDGYQYTLLDFDKHWTVVANPDSTPILKSFASTVPSIAGLKRLFDLSWFDEEATTMTLDSVEDLYGFAILSQGNSFKDKTILLGQTIDLNPGWSAHKDVAQSTEPTNKWVPIGNSNVRFAGTFDGQNNSIKGVYLHTEASYVGLFAYTETDSVIKRLRLDNSEFYCNPSGSDGVAAVGSIVGDLGGTLEQVYSNAYVTTTEDGAGGLAGRANRTSKGVYTMSECWFDGALVMKGEGKTSARYGGGLVGNVVQGKMYINHCYNTGTIYSEGSGRGLYIGGLVGTLMNSAVLEIKNSLNVGMVSSATSATEKTYCTGSILGAGYDKAKEPTYEFDNVCATSDSHAQAVGSGGKANPTEKSEPVSTASRSGMLGIKGYIATNLDFKYWSARRDEVPALKYFVGEGLDISAAKRPDISWYNTTDKKFVLEDESDLYGLAQIVNNGTDSFEGKTVQLKKNTTFVLNKIPTQGVEEWKTDASEVIEWKPIGVKNSSDSLPFKGIFDGNGSTIQGMYMKNEGVSNIGFFGFTSDAVVKNVRFVDGLIINNVDNVDSATGTVAAYGDGTFSNIYSNVSVEAVGVRVGGIIGVVNDGNGKTVSDVSGCWYAGNITMSGDSAYSGGLVGYYMYGKNTIENSLFSGVFRYTSTVDNKSARIGAILGQTNKNNQSLTISNCISVGKVESIKGDGVSVVTHVGSLFGLAQSTTATRVYTTTDTTVMPINGGDEIAGCSYVADPTTIVSGLGTFWKSGVIPAAFNADTTFDTERLDDWDMSCSGAQVDPYQISQASDLEGLATSVNSGNSFVGKYIVLTKDICLNEDFKPSNPSGDKWTPIGKVNYPFKGTFDGNGKEISGLYITNTSARHVGLFGVVSDATVENLYLVNGLITNSYTTNNDYGTGTVAGKGDGTFSNIYSDVTISSSAVKVGGMIGAVTDGSLAATKCDISECWYAGTITMRRSATSYSGGLVGYFLHGTNTLTNCLFSGNFNLEVTAANKEMRVGGLLGQTNASSTQSLTITNCVSTGNLTLSGTGGSTATSCGSLYGRVGTSGITASGAYTTTDTTTMAICGYGSVANSSYESNVSTLLQNLNNSSWTVKNQKLILAILADYVTKNSGTSK